MLMSIIVMKVLFDRPKPTGGCSANGRRRRRKEEEEKSFCYGCFLNSFFLEH
jgi:hypothetical protein